MDNAASRAQFEGTGDPASQEDLEIAGVANADPASSDTDPADASGDGVENRAASRFTLLIRAAKLVSSKGEFVCVVRDVSETGVSLRLFHQFPSDDDLELQMPGGGEYPLKTAWQRGKEAGFEFAKPVDVEQLIYEAGEYPKRGMRLGLMFPIAINTLTGSAEGEVENLSQQGARFTSDAMFAIDQTVRIKAVDNLIKLPEVRAKIRWRRRNEYGVVFDDTLSLADFAQLAARVQCPSLLDV